MVKAIARAFRWREHLENGTHATIAEIAAAEKLNESYVGRVLRLTLLAPDLVEAIVGGQQQAEMTLAAVRGAVDSASAEALQVTALDRSGHTTASSSCRSRNS